MTLSTNVAIRLPADSPVTAQMVLDKAIEALCIAADDGEWGPGNLPVVKEYDKDYMRGRNIGTVIGQGFYAITDVYFNPEGPLYAKDMTHRELYPEDCEDDGGSSLAYPACTYLLDMDTAYGSRFANGLNAWTLHLAVILQLREWLREHDGSLMFEDESSGEWFDGDSDAGFESVLESGGSASNWFHNVVQPIIDAEVAAEGGRISWE